MHTQTHIRICNLPFVIESHFGISPDAVPDALHPAHPLQTATLVAANLVRLVGRGIARGHDAVADLHDLSYVIAGKVRVTADIFILVTHALPQSQGGKICTHTHTHTHLSTHTIQPFSAEIKKNSQFTTTIISTCTREN